MSSALLDVECKKCGFEYASYEYRCGSGEEYVLCNRCGFSYAREINEAKSHFPDSVVWEIDEGGGEGSFTYQIKGAVGLAVGALNNETLPWLKGCLKEMAVCRYTLKRNDEWYIKDLLTDEIVPFSEDAFMARIPEEDKADEPRVGEDWGSINWDALDKFRTDDISKSDSAD